MMRNEDKLIKKHIRRYVKRVRRAAGGLPKAEQDELVRNLTEHIQRRLQEVASGEPMVHDLKAVLNAMDSPEAYVRKYNGGKYAGRLEGNIQSSRRAGRLGLIFLGGGIAAAAILFLLEALLNPPGTAVSSIALLFLVTSAIISFVLGIYGRKDPLGKASIAASLVIILAVSLLLPMRFEISEESAPVKVYQTN